MLQPPTVSLSGTALSFLLLETSKESVKQYGFLLGKVVQTETTLITDNDQNHVNICRIVKINSVVPFPSNSLFSSGRVDKEDLRSYLGPSFTKVVAWYKFGHSPSIQFTIKESVMHKRFKELFDAPIDLFPVCFVSSEATDNFANHSFQQTFALYSNGNFDRLNMHIPNLSDPNNTYINAEHASELFNGIVSSIKTDLEATTGVVAVTEIENAVQDFIDKTVVELADSEKKLFELEQEIALLQQNQRLNVIPEVFSQNLFSGSEEIIETNEEMTSPTQDETSKDLKKSTSPDREPSPEVRQIKQGTRRGTRSQSNSKDPNNSPSKSNAAKQGRARERASKK